MPKGNPDKITGLEDFADESKTDRSLCAPGALWCSGGQGLRGGEDRPQARHLGAGREGDPAKVASDEVDAALVYKTDVICPRVTRSMGIEFPEASRP